MILKQYKILLLLSLFLCACTDDYDKAKESGNATLTPTLSAHWLYPTQTDFYAWSSDYESTMYFNVESIGTQWKFTNVDDWFSLAPLSGSASAEVILTTQPNTSAINSRTAIFYLSSAESDWRYNKAMSVSQSAGSPKVSVDKTELYFDAGSSSQIVNVTANCEWVSYYNGAWLGNGYVNYETGVLTVVVDENLSKKSREGYELIESEAGDIYIKVVQAGSEIAASETTLTFENTASKYSATISSDVSWTATTTKSWISVTPASGKAGTTNVEIEVAPNTAVSSRSGYVDIYTGSNYRTCIEISQKGNYIECVDAEVLEFSSAAESKTLTINSNTDWTITGKPNWVSLSDFLGTGNKAITVTSTENPNTDTRTGTITIEKVGTTLKTSVYVKQKGKFFTLGNTALQFSDKAGTQTFSIQSDASWTSTLSESWLSATPLQGKGNADVNVTVEENKTVTERIGTISYNYCGLVANVNVHQQAKYATIDNSAFTFTSKGGTAEITLLTNDKWKAEIENGVKWLSLSSTSGTGEAKLTLTVNDNASINKRSTVVTITPENAQAVKIYVTQDPRYLRLNSTSILFFANGGTSNLVTIETDGAFEIKSSDSWFTVNKISNYSFTVTAAQNMLETERVGTITISLTGLTEGSLSITLPVEQASKGGTFIINGYGDENNWGDAIGDGSFTIKIDGYTTDNNWNDNMDNKFTVSVTGYTTEHDWNKTVAGNGNVSINPYGDDKSWNTNTSSNGSVTKNEYSNDKNWNN